MATPIESTSRADGDVAPAVLHEGQQHVLPTQHLPGVDFGAHLGGNEVDNAADNTVDPPEAKSGSDSYFSQTPGSASEIKPVQKSRTDVEQPALDSARKPFKRLNTAPAQDSRRPQPLYRSSTLLRHVTRRPDDAYAYTFDPMSSDSDLDSSGDEDTAAPPHKRPGPRRALTKAEKKELEREKQGHSYSRFRVGNENFCSKGKVSKRDGRLNISVNDTSSNGYLAKALGRTMKHHLDIPHRQRPRKQRQHVADHPDVAADAESIASSLNTEVVRPRLNVVIIVIGSRGDIQPFLRIGQILRHQYGHRVRIATHPTFRDFVEKESGLEFFSVGGDPAELMSFMVRNPGLVPNLSTIRQGEIQRRRAGMAEMFSGMWRACTNATEDEKDVLNVNMAGDKAPFIADAIIANPPSMAHVHIAERLGIPLHIMFTFPYSPTQSFPHPLANIRSGKSNVDESYVNFMSYPLVEMMTWQGLGDIVNKFRVQTLGLEPVSSLWAPGALYRMNVPYTYMWSPSLVPKPSDWGPEIDIAGFVFMELANNFDPPQDLVDFLDAGEPPVYIGFGSIVVDDPNQFTELVVEAVKLAGVRALINKGWGGLGTGNNNTPDNIFMLGNTPHDWLFPKVKAVVHHGGAGTTAIGLKCAKPTMIVPFFGDQPFWGARVAEAKAGAHFCVPWKRLTAEKLAEGIKQCLTEEAQRNVQKMADRIAKEGDGAENACKSFHRSLPLAGRQNMRCSILEDRIAVWTLRGSSLRLSALAAEILLEKRKIQMSDLKLFRVYSWNDFDGPGEPVTGTVGAVTDSLYGIGNGVGMVPVRVAKHMKKRAEHERKKAEIQERKQQRKEQKGTKLPKTQEKVNTNGDDRPGARREETNLTLNSMLSTDPTTPLAMELAKEVGEGFRKSGAALLTMPIDLHVALAQGFHNAPRLWGDATVRKPVRITGVKSGLTAARKEFAYGIYDGWTGLVTQPAGGFKDGDTVPSKLAGLGTGLGKGVGGFVLKNISAVVSPPAYAGKGVVVYIKKRSEKKGVGSKAYIRKAHLVAGQRDLRALQQQDDPQKDEQLRHIEDLVREGWKVYEEIWDSANREYNNASGGSHLYNKLKLGREKERWNEAGALENVHAAEKALRVKREGGDIERHFAARKRELDMVEEPRAPAMEQPGVYEERVDGERQEENTFADEEAERRKMGHDEEEDEEGEKMRDEEEKLSDRTVVVAEEDGGDEEKHGRDRAWTAAGHGKGVAMDKMGNNWPKPVLGRLTTA